MRQEKVIWFAIVFSTVIYAVMIYTLYPKPEGTFGEAVKRQQITMILYAVALMTFVAALVVPGMLRSAPPRLKMIVALALFEACVIYGLLAAFLSRDWRLFLPTWIVGLIGMVWVFPSSDREPAATV